MLLSYHEVGTKLTSENIDWATFPTYRVIATAVANSTTNKLSVAIPAGYKNFRVRFVIFNLTTQANNYIRMRFNNDTSASYTRSDGATVDTQDGIVGAVMSTNGYIAMYELDVADNSGKNKPYILRGGLRDFTKISSGEYLKTPAITSISYEAISYNAIAAGSYIVVEAIP